MKKILQNSAAVRFGNPGWFNKAIQLRISALLLFAFLLFSANQSSAHCDSYDGPVIRDAETALTTNNVNFVLKWVKPDMEEEIKSLFIKTHGLINGDKEVYEIVKKHFFETLVRLHRETEGAPYTGLKPAGTTKAIVQMSDNAIITNQVATLISKLNHHIGMILREKYEKVAALNEVKNNSVGQGREYVEAYVDYTHTIEAIHDLLERAGNEHGNNDHAGNEHAGH